MPLHAPQSPTAVLAPLAALAWGAAWLQRAIERRLAAEAVFQGRRRRQAALVGPPDAPGVPRGHPLHNPARWATFPSDALLTQGKLVRYARWLRYWARRGHYAGGTVLVRANAATGDKD